MRALEFYKSITMDQTIFLETLSALQDQHDIHYSIVGGQAVNTCVSPPISLDLDIVVALEKTGKTDQILSGEFDLKRFPHSLSRLS
jgi:hypothetical protein